MGRGGGCEGQKAAKRRREGGGRGAGMRRKSGEGQGCVLAESLRACTHARERRQRPPRKCWQTVARNRS